MWFTDFVGAKIGRFTVPASSNSLVAAVLPASRSVAVGATATALATIINAGAAPASACAISPVTGVPASFAYQTTDPATNSLTGTVNTPVAIPPGGVQTFVIGFATRAPFVPSEVALGFHCAAQDATAIVSGVDTVSLSASTTAVPDLIVVTRTIANDGILTIPAAQASAAFAAATINLGAAANLTATATLKSSGLPVSLTICQTNSNTGQCLDAPSTSLSLQVGTNETPTFSVFATATAAIGFDPSANRVRIEFTRSDGKLAGLSSVAIRTQ